VSETSRTLTLAEAADALGVAPARVRALLASGALDAVPGHVTSVAAADVEALQKRGVVRAVDIAAVEGALDRAIRRRLPELLGERLDVSLRPLADEVATAFADVEASGARVARAEERTRAVEVELAAARQRIAELEQRVVALQMPSGLFRRRRSAVAPA
jgi:hypothetical protein